MSQYNYRHLYYFWVVAKEGGISRAAERLDMAVQTISAQVRELEKALGHQLLKPQGRQLVLTPAGEAALGVADQMFQLGEKLPDVLNAAAMPRVHLRVGTSDGLPKHAIPRLLAPVLQQAHLRLECHEGEVEDLLADLALHRLDMVLADRPAPNNPNLRVYSHALGESPLRWYGLPKWAQEWAQDPATALQRLPLMLPIGHSAVRPRLNQWFEREHLFPRVVGEFEDSALLVAFGEAGLGVFPAPALIHDELTQRHGFVALGECAVSEQFFLIGSERKVVHPLVRQVLDSGSLQ